MHHGELSVGNGFHGVHDVAAGAAGASVMGVPSVVDLATQVEGKGMYAVHATSLMIGASGLMGSGSHS